MAISSFAVFSDVLMYVPGGLEALSGVEAGLVGVVGRGRVGSLAQHEDGPGLEAFGREVNDRRVGVSASTVPPFLAGHRVGSKREDPPGEAGNSRHGEAGAVVAGELLASAGVDALETVDLPPRNLAGAPRLLERGGRFL